jgi:hypothetical protein
VSDAVLDALFDGLVPSKSATSIVELSPAADEALAGWSDRAGGKVTKASDPSAAQDPPPKPPRRRARPGPRTPPTGDERFTPTRLVRRLQETLRGYIESAYPLNDPTLIRARRRLLEEEAGGHLLAQEPYIETTTRYATSKGPTANSGSTPRSRLLLEARQDPVRSEHAGGQRTVLFPSMYQHQERAFREFLVERKDVVVATGTGSGKTECFLVPMLGSLYDEAVRSPETFTQPGVRALILYPMNALVNDQLSRLRLLLGDPAVADAFKRARGRTAASRASACTPAAPRTPAAHANTRQRAGQAAARVLPRAHARDRERLRRLGRYPAKDLKAFYAKHEERRRTYKTASAPGRSTPTTTGSGAFTRARTIASC